MENKIENKYHLPLLVAIPIVWITTVFAGAFDTSSVIDFQMHDTYFVVVSLHVVILISLVLGVKFFLYYSTRSYPFSPFLCWFEIGLTFLLITVLMYWVCFNKVVSTDAMALLFLLLGTWMLMQFFIGVNYFLLMFSQEGKGGESLF